MLRADAGYIAVQMAFLVPGLLAVAALGLLPDHGWRSLLAAAGPAYLAGIAIVLPLVSAGLVLGLPFTVVTFAAIAIAAAVAAGALARRRPAAPPAHARRVPATRAERAVLVGAAAIVVLYLGYAALSVRHLAVVGDNAFIWSHRATALFFFDHLNADYFQGSVYARNHLDYPLLRSLLEAINARAAGVLDLRWAPVELYALWGAFVWTAGWLLFAAGGRAVAWVGVLLALAVLPSVREQTSQGYADPLVGSFTALGALAVALWLQSGRRGFAVFGALMLGAAANTKNEGLVAAIAVAGLATVVVLVRAPRGERGRTLLTAWPAGAVLAVSVLPWQLWLKVNHVVNADTLSLGKGLDPSALADRSHRARLAWDAILGSLADADAWLLMPPLFAAVAVGCLALRRARALVAFYAGVIAILLAALVWVYWISTLEIHQHLLFSVDRTVIDIVLVTGVGLAHLLARVDAEGGPLPVRRETGASAGSRAGAAGSAAS